MSSIEVKTFDNPDESNTSFNNAKMDIVKIGDQRVMRLTSVSYTHLTLPTILLV